MKVKNVDAVFEHGVFRPLDKCDFQEGELVEINIKTKKEFKKGFPENGIIAKLTRNPLVIPNFKPLTREEIYER